MTTEEIIKRYTEANTKTNCVNNLAKELGVPRSTIICELFKSGYKYRELQRAMKNDYKAAESKYKAWIEAGKPDQEITEPESNSAKLEILTKLNEEYKNEIDDLKNKNEELDAAYQKALSDVVKLTEELKGAEKSIGVFAKEKQELLKQIHDGGQLVDKEKLKERIRRLEEEVEEAVNEKLKAIISAQRSGEEYQEEVNNLIKENKRLEELSEQNIRYLKLRDEELKNLREASEREKEVLQQQLQTEKLRADINESDYNSDTEIIKEMHKEIDQLKSRLQKAEHFILNYIVYNKEA